MPDWQERITRHTHPEVRVEHDLRYRLAEPLILGARTWADLGCGNGVAAGDVVGGAFARRGLPPSGRLATFRDMHYVEDRL